MRKKTRKIPLYLKILIGMLLGIIWGVICVATGLNDFNNDWIAPFGVIFINLLKLIAIPLILVSLIKGISDLKDISKLSEMGLKTMGLYLLTTVIAISIGLVLVNNIKPGNFFPMEKTAEYSAMYQETVDSKSITATEIQDEGPLQFLVNIVPENVFTSFGDNANMLQVIFFAILFGLSMILLPEKKVHAVKEVINSLNDIVMKIIDLIMKFAPYGVLALLATVICDVAGENISESYDLFSAIGMYALTVVLGLLIMIFVVYPLFYRFLAKGNVIKFFKGILPAQLLAFSTSSSAATLPVTKECVEDNLDVPEKVSSFVLPIGATINMDGTSLYQAVAAVFIAQAYGIDLSFVDQLSIVLAATLASIGSAAVPGAGMIMLVIVLSAVNLPAEGLALIIAIDRPLDMLRTTVNVTGDSAISSIIAKSLKSKE